MKKLALTSISIALFFLLAFTFFPGRTVGRLNDVSAYEDGRVASSVESTMLAQNSEYTWFNTFCQENFGAEKESLIYERFGTTLTARSAGSWQYISRNSAVFAWETTLPARSYIEYGDTSSYGHQTPESERSFYLHVHHLKGLQADHTYHYRLVSVDERGNVLASPNMTFRTQLMADAIEVPGTLSGPPYWLDSPGATYILTEDITSDVTGINVMAAGITVDLNGHTIVFDNVAGATDPGAEQNVFGYNGIKGPCGVRTSYGGSNSRLYNGTIIQGAGNGKGYPVHGARVFTEVAGVEMIYLGVQNSGIGGFESAHHNTILDLGTVITNRHQGIDAIEASGAAKIYNNLIKRCRHRGITGDDGAEIYHNEIYIDSWDTNSFGIFTYEANNVNIYENRIFGTGYMAIGIGAMARSSDIKIHSNLIHLQATEPYTRSAEYGAQSGAYGVRSTWGGTNYDYYDNLIVVTGRDGGMVRGVWFCPDNTQTNIVFRENTIKAVSENDATDVRGAIVVTGEDEPDVLQGLFINNTVYSNFCQVLLSEPYGAGRNTRFVENHFVKLGNLERYRFIQNGYWTFGSSNNLFVDSTFEGGASYDAVSWKGTGERDFTVGWTLTVIADPGSNIEIRDATNALVFADTIGASSSISTTLIQYIARPDGRTYSTPHTVTVQQGDNLMSKTVTMDRKRTLVFDPLQLHTTPADQAIHLTWEIYTTPAFTGTWRIDYYTTTAQTYTTSISSSAARTATLTEHVQNYQWYTVTLNAMLGEMVWLSDTVKVMPTDRLLYLPLVRR